MGDALYILIAIVIFLAAAALTYGLYYLLYHLVFYLLNFSFKRELITGKFRIKQLLSFSKVVCAIALIWAGIVLFSTFNFGCNAEHNISPGDKLENIQGKISYYIPDTFYVGRKNERVKVRIAKASLSDKVFLEGLTPAHVPKENSDIDTIPISDIMEVNLIETSPQKKLTIQRVNNNSRQAIDTSGYTDWIFEVIANDYGEVNLTVSVSIIIQANGSSVPRDIKVFDKTIRAYATTGKKMQLFLGEHCIIIGSAGLVFFLLLYRIGPELTGRLKIIKIFLASSEELQADRSAIEIFMGRENKKWTSKGKFFDLVIWEDFINTISKTSLQDEYNKAIKKCDVCIILFYTKAGKYTQVEFNTAYNQFKEKGKPLIYTYFKKPDGSVTIEQSIVEFQQQLNNIGHFYTKYTNTEDLLLQLDDQFEKFFAH